ncbi:MAG: Scr1 family TA system antitoxin-like transcriptional regulator, partial [Actinomycetes bacterium]
MAQGPTVRRLQLGRELKRLREDAGLLRDAAADDLGRDASTISKIENGKMTISLGDVKSLLMLYGVALDSADAIRILDVAREARKRAAHRVPDWVRAFVGFEAEADEIKQFEIGLVPGLLQTEAYTRAMTQAGDPTRDPAEVERLVAIRRERQARLTGGDPPRL